MCTADVRAGVHQSHGNRLADVEASGLGVTDALRWDVQAIHMPVCPSVLGKRTFWWAGDTPSGIGTRPPLISPTSEAGRSIAEWTRRPSVRPSRSPLENRRIRLSKKGALALTRIEAHHLILFLAEYPSRALFM
jgi:hypothetical protein